MKIGLLSDTHNHLPETRRALDLLAAHGARHLIHCGDAGEDVIDLLSAVCREQGIRAHVAMGNCDRHHGADARFAPQPEGVECGEMLEFILCGKRCAVLHGHDDKRLAQAVTSGNFDYVFTGHTHRPSNKLSGATRLLNPGSLARSRGGPPTVAILDLATDEVAWIPL